MTRLNRTILLNLISIHVVVIFITGTTAVTIDCTATATFIIHTTFITLLSYHVILMPITVPV